MSLARRQFLRLVASGVVGHSLDLDRLLWVPGAKTFFLPTIVSPTLSEILTLEWERVAPKVHMLYERDDTFYANIARRDLTVISTRDMRIPLRLERK